MVRLDLAPPIPGVAGWELGLGFHHTLCGVVFRGPRLDSHVGSGMGGVSCST